MVHRPKSKLELPPTGLASCIAGCIVRDTRGAELSDLERLNYFPATPLFTATLAQQGQIHMGSQIEDDELLRQQRPETKWFFQPPSDTPQTSWSPGPILGLTIAFYPDAWLTLGGTEAGSPPACIEASLALMETDDFENAWPAFWESMIKVWDERRKHGQLSEWTGSHHVKDWAQYIFAKLALSGSARSLRTAQRRLMQWTGQSRSSLELFVRLEDVHRLKLLNPAASYAEIAADTGFADQSHMGRSIKRATGFSTAALNRKIATEEAFWCYRLLGERF